MLNIGRKTYRNLPEQVGFLTGEVSKIWEALDGMDVYDNVIILETLDPLTPAQLEIINKPVAFIVYSNTLYMKRGVSGSNIYFDAVFQVTGGTNITFSSSEIAVSYPLGTLTQTNNTSVTYSKSELDALLSGKLDASAVLSKLFPVGKIFISADNTSPASLFGGTWTPLGDVFLLSASSSYPAGSTGGEARHTLTIDEIPSHNHGIRGTYGTVTGTSATSTDPHLIDNYTEKTVGTTNNGGSESHNNMPPYLAVYMWQRIA